MSWFSPGLVDIEHEQRGGARRLSGPAFVLVTSETESETHLSSRFYATHKERKIICIHNSE